VVQSQENEDSWKFGDRLAKRRCPMVTMRQSTRLFHPFVHHNFKLGSLLTGGQFGVS
jgi:hypothetical protein